MSYGVTVIMGKVLADRGVDSATALGIRFLLAAALLALLQLGRREPMTPLRTEWLAIILLGAVLYSIQATSFYFGLQHMGAAAVSLIAYCYPALVVVVELLRGDLRLSTRLVTAIVLSTAGVAAVATAGGDTRITTLGVLGALGAAVGFAAYVLISHRFVSTSDPWAIAIWIALSAGAATLGRGVAAGVVEWPAWSTVLPFLGYGLATGVAFASLYAGLRRLGPTRTSIWLNLEAVTAVVLAGVLLGERLLALQLVGGMAVATGAVLATLASARAAPDMAEAPPG